MPDVSKGITTASHAGVKTMLGLHFVSKGLLALEQGKTFSRLFEIRHRDFPIKQGLVA